MVLLVWMLVQNGWAQCAPAPLKTVPADGQVGLPPTTRLYAAFGDDDCRISEAAMELDGEALTLTTPIPRKSWEMASPGPLAAGTHELVLFDARNDAWRQKVVFEVDAEATTPALPPPTLKLDDVNYREDHNGHHYSVRAEVRPPPGSPLLHGDVLVDGQTFPAMLVTGERELEILHQVLPVRDSQAGEVCVRVSSMDYDGTTGEVVTDCFKRPNAGCTTAAVQPNAGLAWMLALAVVVRRRRR